MITKLFDYLIKSTSSGYHHAYLLSGPFGVGKNQLAQSVIKKWLNLPPSELDLTKDPVPNLFVLQSDFEKEQISVQQIRSLKINLNNDSLVAGKRIVFAPKIEDLNMIAANALLKMLEEPPQNTFFLFITSNYHQLPLTILSRVVHLKIPLNESSVASFDILDENLKRFSYGRPALQKELKIATSNKKYQANLTEVKEFLSTSLEKKMQLIELWLKNPILFKTKYLPLLVSSLELELRSTSSRKIQQQRSLLLRYLQRSFRPQMKQVNLQLILENFALLSLN